jgi:hypothetical protein
VFLAPLLRGMSLPVHMLEFQPNLLNQITINKIFQMPSSPLRMSGIGVGLLVLAQDMLPESSDHTRNVDERVRFK